MEQYAVIFGCYLRHVSDVGLRGLISLGVDSVFGNSNNIRLIFDFEFEWSPLQAIGDEVAPNIRRFLFRTFHFLNQRMDFVMLAVIGNGVNDSLGIRLNKAFFFEAALFHADNYTAVVHPAVQLLDERKASLRNFSTPLLVNSLSSLNKSGSTVLKLKQDFPCMFFLSSGEISFSNSGYMNTGIK